MNLTDHFTLSEFIESRIAQDMGISNIPSDSVIEQLKFTAAGMERTRALLNRPVHILSGYRCLELNTLVGGSKLSQHMAGQACDFTCFQFGTPKQCASLLSQHRTIIGIDQLILESTWCHVSFTLTPRYEVLTYHDGKYLQGIV